jgi:hypothetical protein
MMKRRLTLMLAALTAAAITAVGLAAGPLAPQPGHAILHVGCPPGSHGKPRTDGVGARLQQSRDEARGNRPLSQRGLADGHPASELLER